MALSGLDIYKLLPKTNCRECGFATCLAFAMQLAKKAVSVDKCPYLTQDSKNVLEASALPPIKLVTIGAGETKLEIGNETVMFRHEEKFHRPCAIGFIIEDSLSDAQIKERIAKINKLKFERVGQNLEVNLVAIKQTKDVLRFKEALNLAAGQTSLPLVLMSEDAQALKEPLTLLKEKKPLLYHATKENLAQVTAVAKEFNLPLVVTASDLEGISALTQELSKQGVGDLVLDVGNKGISEKVWDFTQIRRLALKKSNRSLGFPVLAIVDKTDPYEEAMEAATYISKYAGIVLIKNIEAWEVLEI